MIKINRPPAPDFLIDPNGIWVKETNEAIAYYKPRPGDPKPEKGFEFKKYNLKRLKDELRNIFAKCAYCESYYEAVYDGDVEHFRPKGKVNEKDPQTPGYYWMANEWDNLYLSCQHCNQRRKHVLNIGEPLQGYGKLDQFPLTDESKRVAQPGLPLDNEENERLILDPCKDDPDEHFAYEMQEGVIVPLTEMGRKSVEVYVLKRPKLVKLRKKVLLKLIKQMDSVKLSLVILNGNPSSNPAQMAFDKALEILLDFTKSEESYAGMCRFFVRSFLNENNLN